MELNNVFGEKSRGVHMLTAMTAGLLAILCAAPLFSMEKAAGTEKLVRAAERGRGRLVMAKYAALWLEILAIWACVYLRQWTKMTDVIGRSMLNAPLGNIEALQDFPIRTDLRGFLWLLAAVRLLSLGMLAHLAAWFSARAGTWTRAALPAAGLLLIPGLLSCLGRTWASWLTPLSCVSGLELLTGTGALSPKTILFPLLLASAAFAAFRTAKALRG